MITEAQLKEKDELIRYQNELISSLQFQLNELKKLIFGSKSERYINEQIPAQLNLFSDPIPDTTVSEPKEKISYERKKTKKHPGRNPLPEHFPVRVVIIEPEGITPDMKVIGKDTTDTVEYTAASLVIRRTIRYKYLKITKDKEDLIIQAPKRNRSIPRCMAEACLLAYIIIAKFIDHLPFHRQIQRFKRDYNWDINKSTINDWFIAVCTLLEPLYDTMVKQVKQSEYIQADESHIKVQDGNKKGATHQGYQWVYHAPKEKIIVFNYRKGRGVNGPKEFLENYSGYLQCDGYKVYDKIGAKKDIHLVGCWVHARRYFDKAKENDKARADYALHHIQKIYHINRLCKDMTPVERMTYRLAHIKPLFDELKTWMDDQAIVVLPKSPIGQAISYTIKQWPKLIAVLEDGRLELDNNLIENKIRPLALGRKNYMFAGNHKAAQRIAMMYSFFATCKANDVNPYQWLKYVIENIHEYKLKELDQLIPSNITIPSDNNQ